VDQRIKDIVLVHGAGSGPWVFDGWSDALAGVSISAVDLLEQVDVAQVSMYDYCERVIACMRNIKGPAVLCGWSMGGLVALMAAQRVSLTGLVLLEPSPPAEVQGFDPEVQIESGTFDPEVVYGAFPRGIVSRPESSRARSERKRGISVPQIGCRTLVVGGDEFHADRGEAVARFYAADYIHFPGLTHWDLVLRPEVRRGIATFIYTNQEPRTEPITLVLSIIAEVRIGRSAHHTRHAYFYSIGYPGGPLS
jgi:pimeloyl-ACP methyl ester carboxylesterase